MEFGCPAIILLQGSGSDRKARPHFLQQSWFRCPTSSKSLVHPLQGCPPKLPLNQRASPWGADRTSKQLNSVPQLDWSILRKKLGKCQCHQFWVLGECSCGAIEAQEHRHALQILKDDFSWSVAQFAFILVGHRFGSNPRHGLNHDSSERRCRDVSHRAVARLRFMIRSDPGNVGDAEKRNRKLASGLPKMLPSYINPGKGLRVQRDASFSNHHSCASLDDSLLCRVPPHAPLDVQRGSFRSFHQHLLLTGKV